MCCKTINIAALKQYDYIVHKYIKKQAIIYSATGKMLICSALTMSSTKCQANTCPTTQHYISMKGISSIRYQKMRINLVQKEDMLRVQNREK
jgi:hypothetical protein